MLKLRANGTWSVDSGLVSSGTTETTDQEWRQIAHDCEVLPKSEVTGSAVQMSALFNSLGEKISNNHGNYH